MSISGVYQTFFETLQFRVDPQITLNWIIMDLWLKKLLCGNNGALAEVDN